MEHYDKQYIPTTNLPSAIKTPYSASLRDQFAMVALQGWFAGYAQDRPRDSTFSTIAKTAYKMAGAMMKQREV